MMLSRSAYLAEAIQLFLEDPDTPKTPSPADWQIAADLHDRRLPLETLKVAFKLAFLRRHKRQTASAPLPPIRSLAYFRAVALNLTPEELEPTYVQYLTDLCETLRLATAPAHQPAHPAAQPARQKYDTQ